MGSDTEGQYFDEQPRVPSRPSTVRLVSRFATVPLQTDRGVFSPDRVDLGTRVLLDCVPDPPAAGTLLDLGCGYGPLTVALASASPRARVLAIDVNERALELCRRNVDELGLGNVVVSSPESLARDEVVDAVWSNPPIHVGKAVLHELLGTWLDRLTPEGQAHLVVQKNLGSDSLQRWLERRGNPTHRIASKKGYRVLRVGAAATR